MIFSRRLALPLVALAALLPAGCSSTPDRYYLLTASSGAPPSAAGGARSIGLGPVRIPDYIDRAELVFQSAPNRFEIPLGHRWAGALEPTITRVLAADLGASLGGRPVQPYPWDAGGRPAYTVAVNIGQFHSLSGGDAILDAAWSVIDGGSSTTLDSRTVTLREPLSEEGYEGVVAAQSRLLTRLAERIAATLPKG